MIVLNKNHLTIIKRVKPMNFKTIKNLFWPTEQNHYQPIILSDKIIAAILLLFLFTQIFLSLEFIVLRQGNLFADISAQQTLLLINKIREEYGLNPLQENPSLEQAALEKAQDMVQNRYFDHFSPSGVSPWYWIKKNGYNYHYAGENLAMNFIDTEEVIRGWLNSPSHRDNLLNKNYQEIGIAVVSGDLTNEGLDQTIVVTMFGSPLKTSRTPIAEAANPTTTKPSPTSTTTAPTTPTTTIPPTTTTLPAITWPPTTASTNTSPTLTSIPPTKVEGIRSEETLPPVTPTSTPYAEIVSEAASLTPTTTLPLPQNAILPTTTTTETSSEDFFPSLIEPDLTNALTTRDKINYFGSITGLLVIIMSMAAITGVIINKKTIPANIPISELLVRNALLLLLGVAFISFKVDLLVGRLLIA